MKTKSISGTVVLAVALASLALAVKPATARSLNADVTGQMVVAKAMRYDHYRYAWTGSSPKTGFSCIGLVWYVFQTLGVDMPGDLSGAMAAYPKIPEADLLPGDIVFFKNTLWHGLSHVGIYIGDGQMISAENFRRGVNISALRNDPNEGSYWQQHYLVAERPLPANGPAVPTTSGPRVTVSVPSLNLRADHSLSAIVETVLSSGTVLSKLDSWGQWINVRTSSGVTGWVVSGGVIESSGGSTSSSGSTAASRYAITNGVNIHDGPALSDQVISVTYPGLRVAVLGSKDGFTHIETPAGLSGWVESQFVPGYTPTRISSSKRRFGRLTITAHIRTGPSLYDRIIQWVPAGTRVAVIGHVPLWDHVRVSRHLTGYIYAEFIQK